MTVPYQPGDRLRVTVEDAYGTELKVGDIVTVDEVATKIDSNDAEIPVVYVTTPHGTRVLGLDAVEPFVSDYAPAEPDADIDAMFAEIIVADRDLISFGTHSDIALGADGQAVSDALSGADDDGDPDDTDEARHGPWREPQPGDTITVRDHYGDRLNILYSERSCAKNGREGALFFTINDDSEVVVMPITQVGPLMRWLFDRHKHSQRPLGEDPQVP